MLARKYPCMREYMRAEALVCLSVCLSVCKYVYTRMCVCPNNGFTGTLCACSETCQAMFAPESLKSWSIQKVSQTNGMVLGGS